MLTVRENPGVEAGNARKTILIVEDEPTSLRAMASYFEVENYRVVSAINSQEMQYALDRQLVDLIVLDLRLPGKDGLTILRELRSQSDIPIIVVSSRTEAIDHVVALEIGADDYLDKPVNLRELLVRTSNLLRRRGKLTLPSLGDAKARLTFGGWMLDPNARSLTGIEGKEVHLTKAEFDLLHLLARHAEHVLSRDQLHDGLSSRAWNPSDRTIDVLIRRLRNKIESSPRNPRIILTVRGIGYVLRNQTKVS